MQWTELLRWSENWTWIIPLLLYACGLATLKALESDIVRHDYVRWEPDPDCLAINSSNVNPGTRGWKGELVCWRLFTERFWVVVGPIEGGVFLCWNFSAWLIPHWEWTNVISLFYCATSLLGFGKPKIGMFIRNLTEYRSLGRMPKRWGHPCEHCCRACGDEEEK